ncbi:hypothetical protein [Botrimarina sp.]|uniref:hypothetical protein n=1 Tax=Botrimarina sp. TaxID=2795802 RepID=UPI0032EF3DF5
MRLAVAAAVLVSGCAGLPRIDPSGRRILVWPEPAAPAAAPAGLPSLGNVDAPPVFSGQTVSPLPPATAPPVGSVAGVPTFVQPSPQQAVAAKPAEETLSITPERVLAPIGSEVVLKAGVCNRDGFLRTNRRVEWMLGQEGAGQFVRVGEQGELDILRLPWQRPDKRDNAYAVGYTAPFDVCLRRGTPDPTDDVQVERGEAWITVTSASEGVSYVTAAAPETDNWDARRATATVYWVDAQWRFPPPQALQPGQAATLTTFVTRQSDNAPIAGWLVRYEVAGGDATAQLGYGGGQSASVPTDASGRATIQVTPTDDRPGTAQVRVTVVRPAQSAPMPSPELVVGAGEAIVTWSPAAVIGPIDTPTTPAQPSAPAPQPPAPFEPPPSQPADPILPPVAGAGPRLEVSVSRESTGRVAPNDSVPVLITLRNTGDAPAEDIGLVIDYDRGLLNANDTMGRYRLERDDLRDLGPGESIAVDAVFEAVTPGRQCLSVTATAATGAEAFERLCVEVAPPAPAPAPELRIEADLDAVRDVGQTLTYLATVYNDAAVAAENVRVEILNSPELTPEQATDGWAELPNGLVWQGERIEAGGRLSFTVEYLCESATRDAVITTYALIDEQEKAQRTVGVEIRPAPDAPPPAAPQASLEGSLSSLANPAQVGRSSTLDATITNTTDEPIENVQFRVLFPPQIEPQLTQAGSPLGFQRNQNAIEFSPIEVLGAGQSYRVAIPYTPTDQGQVLIQLEMRTGATGEVNRAETTVTIRGR